MAANPSSRDANIEIMRGIAVLIVVIYHYTTRLPPEVFGVDTPAAIGTHLGKLGVYIFFVISGYLIAQSLEKSASLGAFYSKRVARIWPLFAFASIIVFVAMKLGDPPVVLTGPDPFFEKTHSLFDLVGSIFLLEDLGFAWSDGAYWSVLVEMKFYFIVGLFAAALKSRFVDAFAIFAIIAFGIDFLLMLSVDTPGMSFFGSGEFRNLSKLLHGVFISNYLPMFALGMMLFKGRHDATFIAVAVLALISAILGVAEDHKFDVETDLVFLLLLAAALFLDRIILGSRLFLWLGKYSYSIYLFHQMIGLTIMKAVAPSIGINAAVVVALCCVCLIAWTASWLVEWRFYRNMVDLLNAAFKLIGLDRVTLAKPAPSPLTVGPPRAAAPQPGE